MERFEEAFGQGIISQADPGFIVVENLFCSFFLVELILRFSMYVRRAWQKTCLTPSSPGLETVFLEDQFDGKQQVGPASLG